MGMNDINSLSHTKWNRKYHIVFFIDNAESHDAVQGHNVVVFCFSGENLRSTYDSISRMAAILNSSKR